jgi:hypothetical protein
MEWIQHPRSLSTGVLISFFLAMVAGDRAVAVTKLHDPVGDPRVIHGVTNGHGVNRGPWVVQIAVAKGNYFFGDVQMIDSSAVPTVYLIAGDGKIYPAEASPGVANFCIDVPVTGWLTLHVGIPGTVEQRFRVSHGYFNNTTPICPPIPPH